MFFDGNAKQNRVVSISGKKRENDKNSVIENTRKQRENRMQEKQRYNAAARIQSMYRGYKERCHFLSNVIADYETQMNKITALKSQFKSRRLTFNVPIPQVQSLVYKLYLTVQWNDKSIVDVFGVVIDSLRHDKEYNILIFEGNSDIYRKKYDTILKLFTISVEYLLEKCLSSPSSTDEPSVVALLTHLEEMVTLLDPNRFDKQLNLYYSFRCIYTAKLLSEFCCLSLRRLSVLPEQSRELHNSSILVLRLSNIFSNIIEIGMNDCSSVPISSLDEPLYQKQKIWCSEVVWVSITKHLFILSNLKSNSFLNDLVRRRFLSREDFFYSVFTSLGHIDDYLSESDINNHKEIYRMSIRERLNRYNITSSYEQRRHNQMVSNNKQNVIIAISHVCGWILQPLTPDASSSDVGEMITKTMTLCQKNFNGFYQHIVTPFYEVIQSLPLLDILFYLETGIVSNILTTSDDDPSNITLDEMDITVTNHAQSLSGVRGLEHEVGLIQQYIRTHSSWSMYADKCDIVDLSNIILFLTHKSTQAVFLEYLPRLGNNNVIDPVHQSIVDSIIFIYSSILLNLPMLSPRIKDFLTDNTQKLGSGSSNAVMSSFSISWLNSLAFGSPANPLSTRLWQYLQSKYSNDCILSCLRNPTETIIPLESGKQFNPLGNTVTDSRDNVLSFFFTFCVIYRHQLSVMDDKEFFDHEFSGNLSNQSLIQLINLLKSLLWKLFYANNLMIHESSQSLPYMDDVHLSEKNSLSNISEAFNDLNHYTRLVVTCRLFNDIFVRQERRKFTEEVQWYWNMLNLKDFELIPSASTGDTLTLSDVGFRHPNAKYILTCIPQVIPFHHRIGIFRKLIDADKKLSDPRQVERFNHRLLLRINRERIIEDTFNALYDQTKQLKQPMQVQFTSETGAVEAGIDGGGLFKDFIDNVTKEAFDPKYGFFVSTSDQLLTPNPASSIVHSNHLQYFVLLGKIIGKAVYEGILSEPQFAGGFLNILLGRVNQIDDLYYLDRQYYTSLMNLKTAALNGEDVSSLGFTFEVESGLYGTTQKYELIPNGSNVPVTNSNILMYIHRLANYKLNIETAEQSRAFLCGFRCLIPIEWIKMFNPQELQLLLSGDRNKIDIQDLRNNVNYGGGYADSQPYIQMFWEVVDSLSIDDQSAFLKFVTSCPRQPLLGFSNLNPKFGIFKVPTYESRETVARLPSAATCMNLLKLPQYDSEEQLRERLLYAIKSNSGFELS